MNNGVVLYSKEGATQTILYDCSQIAHLGESRVLMLRILLGGLRSGRFSPPIISDLEYMPFIWRKNWKAIFAILRGSVEWTTPAVKSGNISPMLWWPLNWVNMLTLFFENCIFVYWTLGQLDEKSASTWRSDRSTAKWGFPSWKRVDMQASRVPYVENFDII